MNESGYSVARFVFGSEPTEAELLQFIKGQFHTLSFSQPAPFREIEAREVGFKRRQRQARQHMQQGIGTFAQRALQAEYERTKQARYEERREDREAREQEKFLLKQAQKKQKHRN